MSAVIKKYQIYKKDKWNMMNVEVHGKQIVLREISDQWGEECHTFLTRSEMMEWANRRFSPDRFEGTEEERQEILASFRDI